MRSSESNTIQLIINRNDGSVTSLTHPLTKPGIEVIIESLEGEIAEMSKQEADANEAK